MKQILRMIPPELNIAACSALNSVLSDTNAVGIKFQHERETGGLMWGGPLTSL